MNSDFWWQKQDQWFFSQVLSNINRSFVKSNWVDKTDNLFKALNTIWNAYPKNKGRSKPNDTLSFETLVQGLDHRNMSSLLTSKELTSIVMLNPKVMDHGTLIQYNYDPNNIPPDLVQTAQEQHIKMENQYRKLVKNINNIGQRQDFLRQLIKFMYMIRSNIMHGEKTPTGPDRYKVNRDQTICKALYPFLVQIVEIVFDFPSTRLAVYGSLEHGQPNSLILDDIKGTWGKAWVEGKFFERNGLKYFNWDIPGQRENISVFSSARLAEKFDQLDKFEGSEYQRIWVPVENEVGILVANIYASSNEWR